MLDPKNVEITTYRPSSHGNSTWLQANGITAFHLPTSLGVTVDSERSQYANKEKALQLLESLVLATAAEEEFQRVSSIPNKVKMIKDVRQAAGCGLKEAKEAVDKMGTFEGALLHITGSIGHCKNGGDACVCGGDLPAIREGCYNWQK